MFTVHFTIVCDNIVLYIKIECKLKELPEFCNVYEYQFSATKAHPEIILLSYNAEPHSLLLLSPHIYIF